MLATSSPRSFHHNRYRRPTRPGDQLDEDAAEVLAYARWLLSEEQCLTSKARLVALQAWLDERPRDWVQDHPPVVRGAGLVTGGAGGASRHVTGQRFRLWTRDRATRGKVTACSRVPTQPEVPASDGGGTFGGLGA